ncbi:hypothetical protein DPMN_151099 [Dreissena polymorpha]|uniref:CCHC-type domain-containing protein n=1 Tax=Dreissena polymorpha TaxID=45954 RepID=A0A9D4FHR1_DREPO|nr:hypothetical protein DPMN_151099 [Dreissena polymorpha]
MDRTKLVDVDTASEDELRELPGIGPKVAHSIITYRELHGRITRYDLATIPHLRSSPLLWSLLTFSKSEGESMIGIVGQEGVYKEMEKDKVFDQSGDAEVLEPVTNLGQDVITRVSAAIDNANLSGRPSSYVKSSDAKVVDHGARPKVAQHKTEALWYKGSVEQSGPYGTNTPTQMAFTPKPVQHQAATQPKVELGWQHGSVGHSVQNRPVAPTPYMSVNHGMQAGPHQVMAQMPMPHGTYPVQFHAMSHGVQPGQWPQGGQLQYMLVGGQGQLIDSVNPVPMTYMMPPVQSGYVTSTPVTPAPQVDRSGAPSRVASRSVAHAGHGASDTAAATIVQRAVAPGQHKSKLQSLPKALIYDGRGSWQAFMTKFEKYAGIFEWEDREKRDYLCLCLTDKASEYYALVMDREVELGYHEVVDKLERRFGYRDLPETARVTFCSARQGEEESVDDWADRVLTLAGKAYRDLPEAYMLQESILRFCMGAREKEAGEQVINQRPVSIEQAIDKLKWAIHTHGLMYGRPKMVKKVECEGPVEVSEVKVAQQNRLVERVVALEKKGERLEEKLDLLMGKLDQLLARPITNPSISPSRRQCYNCKEQGHYKRDCPKLRSRSPSPVRNDRCYQCNELGHMARECPNATKDRSNDTPREGKKVSFADLNGKGSG